MVMQITRILNKPRSNDKSGNPSQKVETNSGILGQELGQPQDCMESVQLRFEPSGTFPPSPSLPTMLYSSNFLLNFSLAVSPGECLVMHLPFNPNLIIASVVAFVMLTGCGSHEVKPIELVHPLDLEESWQNGN